MGILKHLVLTGSFMLVAVTSMANPTFSSDKTDFRLETIAQGLEHPWSLAFLPDGSMLVTEREGQLRMIEGLKLAAGAGVLIGLAAIGLVLSSALGA